VIGGDDGRKIICLIFERRGVDIDDLLTCLRPGVGRTPRNLLEKRNQLEDCVGFVYDLVGPSCIAEEFSAICGFPVSEKRIQRLRADGRRRRDSELRAVAGSPELRGEPATHDTGPRPKTGVVSPAG
jgi:hypothetical protein